MRHSSLVPAFVFALAVSAAAQESSTTGTQQSAAQPTTTKEKTPATPADAAKAAAAQPAPKKPSRVFTNKDLTRDFSTPSAPAASTSAGDSTSSAPAADSPVGLRDEKYWKDRMRALQQRLDADQRRVNTANDRLNEIKRVVGSMALVMTDPTHKSWLDERNRLQTEHAEASAAVKQDQEAIAKLEDEARRNGVPSGWLRLP